MENEKIDSIKELKEKYSKLQDKYSLPKFEELNNEFSIEKSEKDTEYFLREIIKFMTDKIQNYMRFLEGVLNPSNASIFIFSLVKLIDNGKRAKLSEIYKKFSEYEIKLIKLDLESTESSEAEFIKESFEMWKETKKELLSIIEFVEKNFSSEQNSEQSKKSNYFN